jgi:hypothetical protein
MGLQSLQQRIGQSLGAMELQERQQLRVGRVENIVRGPIPIVGIYGTRCWVVSIDLGVFHMEASLKRFAHRTECVRWTLSFNSAIGLQPIARHPVQLQTDRYSVCATGRDHSHQKSLDTPKNYSGVQVAFDSDVGQCV